MPESPLPATAPIWLEIEDVQTVIATPLVVDDVQRVTATPPQPPATHEEISDAPT